jgi:D-alanyl-D-alanine carboxypeptidase
MKSFASPIINFLVLVGLITLSGCGSSDSNDSSTQPPPPPPPIAIDYQLIIDDSVSDTFPGIVLAIEGPNKSFIGSAGLSSIEYNTAMLTSDVMPNGSAGKKATALLAALLYQQGLLDFDLTIDQYLSAELLAQIEFGSEMTIRQLLQHTAGVHDYLDDTTAGDWFDAIIADPTSLKTDEYALQFALNQPAYFSPGTDFHYSNTGYLLVGMIMDQVLGEHHYRAMRELVFEPLGLNDTYYNGLEKHRGEIISGYFEDDGERLNTKPVYENIGVADAPLVSSAVDLSKLIRAIVTDMSVINDEVRALLIGNENLTQIGNQLFYGMGMFKETINGKTVYHHGGDEPGYLTSTLYIQDTDTTMTLMINCNLYQACESKAGDLIDEILITLL